MTAGGPGDPPRPHAVCVFCASGPVAPEPLALAAAVGAGVAARGWTLVTGGGRVSMMGEVARAARAGGGHTVGVIPEALVGLEVADDDADELVVTADLRARKAIMDRRSDAVLALPGGLGTLEELTEAWTARSLGLHAKPVVVLDPDGHYDPLFAWLDGLRTTGFVGAAALGAVERVSTVAAALEAVRPR